MNTVTVIVSHCAPKGDRVYGERLTDTRFSKLDDALKFASPLREQGKSVLVRPNYNERDSKGRFYREWRSFNGEPFQEIRFDWR